MTFTLTRQQIYDLVWSEAMKNLATKIGISDVAIAKHCRKCDVPVPPRGYWNKVHAGKRPVQTSLAPFIGACALDFGPFGLDNA